MSLKHIPALAACALLLAAAPGAAADEVPTALKPYITVDEFRAAGLHRLAPDELAAFQLVFLRAVAGDPVPDEVVAEVEVEAEAEAEAEVSVPEAVRSEGRRWFGLRRVDRDEIEARFVGTFEGWRPGMRIELDNGQVWRVVGQDSFQPDRRLENPKVTLREASMDAYMFSVEGYNASVRVRLEE